MCGEWQERTQDLTWGGGTHISLDKEWGARWFAKNI